MNRFSARVLAAASLSAAVLAPARGFAASLVQVNKSDWAGSVKLPSYMQMYIYVPDQLATKPPIMVSSHSCGSTATGQIGNIPLSKAAADKNGFILILPDNPGQNCWDVGTKASLTHDGGGDTQAVAQMVKYAIMKYGADPARVYAMGGSGGGMMTQALMAVYPDVFRAGSARAGVPAGCWSDGYASSNQWSDNCAGGRTTKTAQQWGDLVRGMYPGYTGHRPRIQTMQGEADSTISYNNTKEAVKEWTNVLELPTEPTSMDKGYKAANASYDRQFWANACGYSVLEVWSSPGGTHSMPYEEADILKFFGLDVAGGADPEPDCNGMGGAGGMGGAPGAGGMAGAPSAGGQGGANPSGGTGAGGMPAAAGTPGAAGTGAPAMGGTGGTGPGTGGAAGNANGASGGGTGGAPGSGGSLMTGTGGGTPSGGHPGSGGSVAGSGGASGSGTTSSSGGDDDSESGGCGIARRTPSKHPFSAAAAFGLALFAVRRRRRGAPR